MAASLTNWRGVLLMGGLVCGNEWQSGIHRHAVGCSFRLHVFVNSMCEHILFR